MLHFVIGMLVASYLIEQARSATPPQAAPQEEPFSWETGVEDAVEEGQEALPVRPLPDRGVFEVRECHLN